MMYRTLGTSSVNQPFMFMINRQPRVLIQSGGLEEFEYGLRIYRPPPSTKTTIYLFKKSH